MRVTNLKMLMYYADTMQHIGTFPVLVKKVESVLPTLCPEDSEPDYHSFDRIHNGSEAFLNR